MNELIKKKKKKIYFKESTRVIPYTRVGQQDVDPEPMLQFKSKVCLLAEFPLAQGKSVCSIQTSD